MEKFEKGLKYGKAVFAAVWFALKYLCSGVVKVVKALHELQDMCFIYNVLGGIGIGAILYLGMTYPIGHLYGPNGLIIGASAPLAGYAWWVSIFFGGLYVFVMTLVDIQHRKDDR
jgi:hypothetical protein